MKKIISNQVLRCKRWQHWNAKRQNLFSIFVEFCNERFEKQNCNIKQCRCQKLKVKGKMRKWSGLKYFYLLSSFIGKTPKCFIVIFEKNHFKSSFAMLALTTFHIGMRIDKIYFPFLMSFAMRDLKSETSR